MTLPPLTRRKLFESSAWSVGAALVLPLLLEACAPASPTASSAAPTAAAGKFSYPTFVPVKGPPPDLPGTSQGVADAYFSYPKNLVKTVTTPPGSGDAITLFTNPAGGMPPPVEQNAAWQQVNKELNVDFRLDLAGTAQDAAAKLSTIIAGGDLPDILFLGPVSGGSIANLPDFLEAKCADLTPFLAGDAVKAYPNLANYPGFAWRAPGVAYNNKIFGVPVVRAIAGNVLQVRQDVLGSAGTPSIKSADDFARALKAVTRPNDNVWGIADQNFTLTPLLAAQIFGAPNNWGRDSSGKLVKDYETEPFKAGIGFLRDLWSAGVFHPNTPTYTNVSAGSDFRAGRFGYYYFLEDALQITWAQLLQTTHDAQLRIIDPFSADGKAAPIYFLGTGNFGGSVLKKASADRIKEILGVLNYFGAPFGSQESLLLTYGLKDTDFSMDGDGNPVPSQGGFASHPVPWAFMTHGPVAVYSAVRPKDYANLVHGAETTSIPVGVQDATLGLYSATNGKQGPILKQMVNDGIAGIISGRQPLSDWEGLVRDWVSKGGDQIRQEYQQALATRATS
jgi:putative aldouronate transport system substrate-binding protein